MYKWNSNAFESLLFRLLSMCGCVQLILYEERKGIRRQRKTSVLHSGEGRISTIRWRHLYIAWANDSVRISAVTQTVSTLMYLGPLYLGASIPWGLYTLGAFIPWGPLYLGGIYTLGAFIPWGHLYLGGLYTLGASIPWGHLYLGGLYTLGAFMPWGPLYLGGLYTLGASIPWGPLYLKGLNTYVHAFHKI